MLIQLVASVTMQKWQAKQGIVWMFTFSLPHLQSRKGGALRPWNIAITTSTSNFVMILQMARSDGHRPWPSLSKIAKQLQGCYRRYQTELPIVLYSTGLPSLRLDFNLDRSSELKPFYLTHQEISPVWHFCNPDETKRKETFNTKSKRKGCLR